MNATWATSTVGEQFDVQLGKMLDAAKNVGVPKPYLGNRAVQWGRVDVSACGVVPMTRSDLQRYRLRNGDLLVCEGGDVGRGAIWRNELPECYYQKALHRLRAKNGYDARLMLAFLAHWSSTCAFADFVTQTSIAHLPREKFVRMPLPLPSKAEQRRIGDVLQDADDLIATLQRLIAKKQAIKQGMMQQLLTGRTRLPGFNQDWADLRAGDLGTFTGGSGFAPRYQGAMSGQIPFFKVSDMNNDGNELFMRRANNYVTESQRKSMGAVLMPPKAIVFAKVGAAVFLERKRILTAPSCIDNNMAAYCVDKSRVDVRFMHYFLSAFPISSLVTTGALPSLNGGQLRSIPISLPNEVDEQRAIAAALAGSDAEIDALSARLAKARDIKIGMMQQLLTGRVRLSAAAAS
ncbi:restriction endonuclease subunit S [Mycobacterium sp.]|uniref:restriction endonuclease subunit S n=1 Tax=Mycobacterium sp. TaxID=1785 RepID=UPI0031D0B7BA